MAHTDKQAEQLRNARKTLERFFPGGSLRWTNAQQVEDAIRVIARDEMKQGA